MYYIDYAFDSVCSDPTYLWINYFDLVYSDPTYPWINYSTTWLTRRVMYYIDYAFDSVCSDPTYLWINHFDSVCSDPTYSWINYSTTWLTRRVMCFNFFKKKFHSWTTWLIRKFNIYIILFIDLLNFFEKC